MSRDALLPTRIVIYSRDITLYPSACFACSESFQPQNALSNVEVNVFIVPPLANVTIPFTRVNHPKYMVTDLEAHVRLILIFKRFVTLVRLTRTSTRLIAPSATDPPFCLPTFSPCVADTCFARQPRPGSPFSRSHSPSFFLTSPPPFFSDHDQQLDARLLHRHRRCGGGASRGQRGGGGQEPLRARLVLFVCCQRGQLVKIFLE